MEATHFCGLPVLCSVFGILNVGVWDGCGGAGEVGREKEVGEGEGGTVPVAGAGWGWDLGQSEGASRGGRVTI